MGLFNPCFVMFSKIQGLQKTLQKWRRRIWRLLEFPRGKRLKLNGEKCFNIYTLTQMRIFIIQKKICIKDFKDSNCLTILFYACRVSFNYIYFNLKYLYGDASFSVFTFGGPPAQNHLTLQTKPRALAAQAAGCLIRQQTINKINKLN